MKLIPDQEYHETMSPSTQFTELQRGFLKYSVLSIEIEDLMKDCDKENHLLTRCMEDFYDREFGTDYKNMIIRMFNYSSIRMHGMRAMEELTGCQKPCKSYKYSSVEILTYPIENHNSPYDEIGLLKESGNNGSSFFALVYNPPLKYKVIQEQPASTAIIFISEVGGIMGIFVGVSFWSIYQLTISPLITNMESKLSSAKMNIFS